MSSELQFEASSHTYTLGGQVLPSVTQVLDEALREYVDVPVHYLEAAAEFGDHVHRACDLFDRGILDRGILDPRLAPYVDAWTKFRTDSGVVVLASEKRVHHPALGYAGTLDVLGLMPRKKVPAVIDRKSSALVPRSVGAQTAAYREAHRVHGHQVDSVRYCVHLKGDGTYRLQRLTDPSDFSLFTSCLNVWRFRNVH
ncbi:MAG: hypothetical protein V4457_06080 [Pseudomonadota bacterium]